MANAPVYFVLGQVRFNPILTLEQYVPAIQDNLRKAGFPDFQKVFVASINLNLGAPSHPQPIPALSMPQARYLFLNGERTAGFVLEPSFLTFQTTHYETFEPFVSSLLKGLEIVNKNAELSFSERLGIRYLDAVVPEEGEGVAAYLAPSVLGMIEQLKDRRLIHSVSETRTEYEKTTLVSRAVIYRQQDTADPRVAFPPDLQPEPLQVREKFRKLTGVYGVIDTDCWHENRENFDINAIEEHLRYLHSEIRRSFDLMVTPHALENWK